MVAMMKLETKILINKDKTMTIEEILKNGKILAKYDKEKDKIDLLVLKKYLKCVIHVLYTHADRRFKNYEKVCTIDKIGLNKDHVLAVSLAEI